jgi:hypothetical protein
VHFNTAVIKPDGSFIVSRPHIAAQYIKFWFWVDFLSTVPWEFFTTSKGTGLLKLLKLLRLGRYYALLIIRVLQVFAYMIVENLHAVHL